MINTSACNAAPASILLSTQTACVPTKPKLHQICHLQGSEYEQLCRQLNEAIDAIRSTGAQHTLDLPQVSMPASQEWALASVAQHIDTGGHHNTPYAGVAASAAMHLKLPNRSS